uniref:Integrase catalytic domain-containing protein n=1 Tax=Oryzias melastigma TaxID=30732 RepID=A0A3B3CY36_ORYME
MGQDSKEWIETCPQCVCNKAGPSGRAPLHPICTSYPFEVVGVDFLSLGRPEDRYQYILVITDLFTKYAIAVPARDQTAETTVRLLYDHLVHTFGCPERILTDRGAAFESALMTQLCQLYGCKKSRTTAYHPQGNGACERFNQTLIRLLSSLTEVQQQQWPTRLPALVQAYNNTIHSTTGITPHYGVFGRHARLPVDWVTGLSSGTSHHTLEGWVKKHHEALQLANQAVKEYSEDKRGPARTRYNRNARLVPLLPGERVLIRNFRWRSKGKLAPRWGSEPFVIVKQLGEDHPTYLVHPEGKDTPTRTVHRNNLRPCLLQGDVETPHPLMPFHDKKAQRVFTKPSSHKSSSLHLPMVHHSSFLYCCIAIFLHDLPCFQNC